MIRKEKNNKGWVAGLLTAAAASLCCITPVLAFLGGFSGLAASFSWIEPYRPYLIGTTIAIFSFAWYQKLKPGKELDCDCETGNKESIWQSKKFLAIITIVAGLLIAFPYYAKIFYPNPTETKIIVVDKNDMKTAEFKIRGMTCEDCTREVNNEIRKVNGVMESNTFFKKANSIVKFDGGKTNIDSIAEAINKTGYKVISQTIIAN